jgi:flavin reductase (DIM6/NTAB) family NADH-FMN oxidoreductase RutF
MLIDTATADLLTIYQTLISVVTPRPIAWVTTADRDGRVNLAPFSFFNGVGGNPPLARQMNLSSKELPHGESEVELAGLSLEPSVKVRPPRLRESPVQMECRVKQVLQFGEGLTSANLVIGEVLLFHVADAVLDGHGRIDPRKLRTIGRLGGDNYCRTDDIFEMKRP